MGILSDNLRAPDARTVVRAMEEQAKQETYEMELLDAELPNNELGDPPSGAGLAGLGRLDATGMHDDNLLCELIAVIRRVPASQELVRQTLVWPTTPPPGEEGPDEDDPWATGPWVVEFDIGIRDTLAGVSDNELPDIASRWGHAEVMSEFGAQHDTLLDVVGRLVRFAREARTNGEQLYSWVCL